MNLRKVYAKARLSPVRWKNCDGRFGIRIEVSVVERRNDFRFESRTFWPGSTATGDPVEANGHGLDGFPALVEYHITVYRKVERIPENAGTD